MGAFADSLFSLLLGWVRGLVGAIMTVISSGGESGILPFLGKNWLAIVLIIIAIGLAGDWFIWMVRWQPYRVWGTNMRRVARALHIGGREQEDAPQEPEEPNAQAPEDAMAQTRLYQRPGAQAEENGDFENIDFAPDAQDDFDLPPLTPEDEAQAYAAAEDVQDAQLGDYPGMRYDSAAQQEMDSTQRYGAVTQEGPGAAEVARRRAEIEAWQLQMQEEARARAEAERAAHEAYEAEQARLAQEAYEAEQARLAQEAYEAEQARLAQEAYEAEQARLAQEEYERQMAEYERQKAQYERELAEYERQKAAYDAQMAREAAAQQMQEQAGELAPAQSASRRRRGTRRSYSDYVEGEDVADLPDAPQWPQIPDAQAASPAESAQKKAGSKLLGRMAKMIEPEEEQLAALPKLPPRVDMHDAYRTPAKPGRRNPRI